MREDRDQNGSLHKGNKHEETIIACKEALNSLDLAAESAVELFSRLKINSGEEVLGGAGAQLMNEAVRLLPSIINKVNAIARLVRCRKNDMCVTGLDQLLGKSAEGKLERIAEIPKENT